MKLQNQIINEYSFKLFQICLIVNYEKSKNDEIKINDKTFIYLSSQNIYFNNLLLNYYSVIRFYIPDYKDNNNFYSKIEIEGYEKLIISNDFFFVVVHSYENYFDFYTIKIMLKPTNPKEIIKIFTFKLIHGALNNIICFINNNNESYFYEYYYYSFISYNLPSTLTITIGKNYIISMFDNFDSEKRRRFNLLNVPKNKDFQINNIKSNSFQICILYDNGKIEKLGLFDLEEIKIHELEDNFYFDKYYDIFGDVFDQINNLDSNKFIDYCKNIYDNQSIDYIYAKRPSNFKEKISISQFKTKIGIILCYFIGKYSNYLKSQFDLLLKEILLLNEKCIKYNLSNFEKLNLLYFIIYEFFDKIVFHKKKNYQIIFLDELNDNSPYKLAYINNKKEIEYLNENSYLFFCYLQLNSFILTNYFQNNEKSYHLTMGNIFTLKEYLLKSYQKFFIIERKNEKKFSSYNEYFKIIKINEEVLFPDFNYGIVKNLEEINRNKDLAIPISSSFRHEINGHRIRSLKNENNNIPTIYFKREGAQKIIFNLEGKIKGEFGRIVESFIGTKEEIYNIDCSRHLGEILDYKYYIQENFDDLKQKIKELEYLKTIKPPIFDFIDNLNFESKEKNKNIYLNKKNKNKTTDLIEPIENYDPCWATISHYLDPNN